MMQGDLKKIQFLDSSGETRCLEDFPAKAYLVVNVASKCGFTSQYAPVEELYEKYKDKGLVILAFPCNQFANQEPGTNAEIKEFCQLNYNTQFPLMSKIDVNGKEAHPLFEALKEEAPGILGTKAVKWNFTKFLIDVEKKSIQRFAPKTHPKDIEEDIKRICLN